MQSTSSSVAPWQVCYYPIPNRYHSHSQHHLHLRLSNNKRTIPIPSPLNCQTHFTNNTFLTIPPTTSYSSSDQERKKNPIDKREFSEELFSPVDDNRQVIQSQKRKIEEGKAETESEVRIRSSNSAHMWWAEVKAAIGQRINVEGIVSSVSVVARDRHLALPHVSVPDIRYIDWEELKREGFKGVVFDKDNTITVPYSLKLWGPLGSSMEQCKAVFGNDIAVFSNSAGLSEFDPDGRKARAVEYAIGIKVIRHRVKKPAGTAEEIEKHFGYESSRLIMVGDRPFTDVVYGNRNGFLTVLTEPLSLAEEPFIVQQVRKLEVAIVNRWSRRGLKPKSHGLFPDPQRCVKDPPPL